MNVHAVMMILYNWFLCDFHIGDLKYSDDGLNSFLVFQWLVFPKLVHFVTEKFDFEHN